MLLNSPSGFSSEQVLVFSSLVDNFYTGAFEEYESSSNSNFESASSPSAQVVCPPACSDTCDGCVLGVPDELLCSLFLLLAEENSLNDAARLSCTCKRMRTAYKHMLQLRQDLALQVEMNIRTIVAKRRLARRLTLTHHETYIKKEVALEVTAASMLLLVLSLCYAVLPKYSWAFVGLINFAVFSFTHFLLHTAILAIAYRTCAALGMRMALMSGLCAISLYYLVLVFFVQLISGIEAVPSHLNLEPWNRQGVMPFYPLAVLVWPFFGTSLHWRLIHIISNCFAWCYGVYEWKQSFQYVKARNGIKF